MKSTRAIRNLWLAVSPMQSLRPKNKQPEVILVRSGSVTTRIYTTEKSGNCCYSVAWICGGRRLRAS